MGLRTYFEILGWERKWRAARAVLGMHIGDSSPEAKSELFRAYRDEAIALMNLGRLTGKSSYFVSAANSWERAAKEVSKSLMHDKERKDVARMYNDYAEKAREFSKSRRRIEKEGRIERGILGISILFLIVGLFFLSSNLTGNAIANLPVRTVSWFGAFLVLMGIVFGFFLLRRMQKADL